MLCFFPDRTRYLKLHLRKQLKGIFLVSYRMQFGYMCLRKYLMYIHWFFIDGQRKWITRIIILHQPQKRNSISLVIFYCPWIKFRWNFRLVFSLLTNYWEKTKTITSAYFLLFFLFPQGWPFTRLNKRAMWNVIRIIFMLWVCVGRTCSLQLNQSGIYFFSYPILFLF